MEFWLYVIGFFLLIALIGWIADNVRMAKLYSRLKPRLDNLDAKEAVFVREQHNWAKAVEADKHAIETLAHEKSAGFPWLAQAYADYFHLNDLATASHLEQKSHPARKAAEHVREVAEKRRIAEKLWRVLKYQLEYYENLFPWLVDFKGEDLDDLIRQLVEKTTKAEPRMEDEEEDPVRYWVTRAEYEHLSSSERNQLALDRYWQKKKSSWELGRDYERFTGYQYEMDGWGVSYQGIVEGLADLGRDLVAVKDNRVEIVQCKYWSKDKVIHEKHIFQLYGTLVAYRIDHPEPKDVSPVFITSTSLSDRAKQFAETLGVRVDEGRPFDRYPCIKCNISRRDATKIYHLPFDQLYDRTLVEQERLERYVATAEEAEKLGFRRAFRWRGENTHKA
jgi:hypothetical protein